MVDYYGACDRQGKAVGHSPKAAREYRTLFSEKDEVDLAVSPCIAAEEEDAGFGRIYRLPYNIVEADYDRISKRILDKFRILKNIHQVSRIKGYDVVWFYRVDFFLMLYMIFAGSGQGRRICLVYQMGGGTGIVGGLISAAAGSLLYRIMIQAAYMIDMPSYAVKLLSTLIVVAALALPLLKKKLSGNKKGGDSL